MQIRSNHPLNRLFAELVERHLVAGAGIADIEIARYIASLLVQFTHVDNLYRIRNAKGRRLEEVADMLIESNPLLGGRSFFYEREVRKHIGDYTMFMAGVFPEYVSRLPTRGLRIDSFIDYLKAGKESYRIVASFDQFEFERVAPLYRKLAERFELCVYGLNLVKDELQQNQRGWYGSVRRVLEF
jgi:hypothetical protein